MYIRRLHEYNYLKDVAFELCETIAKLKQVSVHEVFQEYGVRDTEN